jgi:hypothetical protein
MNALVKRRESFFSFFVPRKRDEGKAKPLLARPCGEVDYDALADEVIQRYPKILGRLAE